MKRRIMSTLVVLLMSVIPAGCAVQGGITNIGASAGILDSYSWNSDIPDASFTEDEYQKLLALQFPGYEDMSVSEFREKVWDLTDTEDYLNLLERFSKSELLYACKDSDEAASFLFYILEPLTAEKWRSRTFNGSASTDRSASADNALSEFTVTLRIDNADQLTVGEYNAARLGMTEGLSKGLQDILLDKTDEQLQDKTYMLDVIDTEIEKRIQRWSSEDLYISVEYSYMPLSLSDPEDSPQTAWQEQEHRRFPNGTEADYRSLFALKTPGYQNMPVADFNMELLNWANEDHERMERINGDIGYNDFAVSLTEEERAFVMLSVNFSGAENGKYVQSNYTDRAEEDPVYNQYLPEKTEERNGRSAWCELFYQFSYHIEDKKKITVGERDQCVDGMITDIRAFWESTKTDTLLQMRKEDVIKVLQEIADSYCTGRLTITIREDSVSFERMDERTIDPYCYQAENDSASYEKLISYQTEDYGQKSVADFNASLAGSRDALSELFDAYAKANPAPEDENYDFFMVTLCASTRELYGELFKEDPFFYVVLSKKERPTGILDEGKDMIYNFYFSAEGTLCYRVNLPETLTVAERDSALTTFRDSLQSYVDGLSEAEIMEGDIRAMLMEKAEELTDSLSSESITLWFEINIIDIFGNGTDIRM